MDKGLEDAKKMRERDSRYAELKREWRSLPVISDQADDEFRWEYRRRVVVEHQNNPNSHHSTNMVLECGHVARTYQSPVRVGALTSCPRCPMVRVRRS